MTAGMRRAILTVLAGWLAISAAVFFFRPLMPVDETRYLTVAWEMYLRHSWVLPTLNFEPYSHKPPMLFWIILAGWKLGGLGITPVRLLLSGAVIGLFFLTARLARHLFPAREGVPPAAMLVLAGLPLFLVYASMIMFDTLLACAVTAGLIAIRHAALAGSGFKRWAILGGIIGLGILIKGPVALVYILPSALLAPLWLERPVHGWGRWYGGILAAIGTGAAIALCWAIPAAITGGDAYAQKIFVTQSAGRMVNAFDHREPFWFYGPMLAAFILPLLAWPALWRGASDLRREKTDRHSLRFLLCAAVPVFVFFSTISSKQIHYMVPILPAISILAATALTSLPDRTVAWRSAIWPVLLSALPSFILLAERAAVRYGHTGVPAWANVMGGFLPWVAVAHIGFAALLAALCRIRPHMALHAFAAAAFALVVTVHVQAGQSLLPRYDFGPTASVIQAYKHRPLAVAPKYDGEYGYAFLLEHPVTTVEGNTIDAWLAQNPDGVVIIRNNEADDDLAKYYNILARQPFRNDKLLQLVEAKKPR